MGGSLFEQKKTTEPSLYPFGGFSLRWWFTDFLTQIFADFPLNSSTLAPYVLLRLSRQIFQLFNKVDSAGKFLPLRRIHTADISLGSDMLLLLLFLSYRRDTYYWLYSSPKPKTVRTGKTGPINPKIRPVDTPERFYTKTTFNRVLFFISTAHTTLGRVYYKV